MKELGKKFYLIILKVYTYTFLLFVFQKKNYVVFVNEFPYIMDGIIQNLSLEKYTKKIINPKKTRSLKILREMKKANYIFCDNYNVLLTVINSKNKKIIQTWHAAGAIKKIGFLSSEIQKQSPVRKKRYQKVYDSFDYYLCASKHMQEIFVNSFNQPKEKMLTIGYPKIDIYSKKKYNDIVEQLKEQNFDRFIKKNILYAPTFRDNIEDNLKQIQFLLKLEDSLVVERYNIFYKLHPKVLKEKNIKKEIAKLKYAIEIEDNDLEYYYALTDLLITDYSSVIFEYLLFNENIILYPYDLEVYQKDRGLNIDITDLSYNIYTDGKEIINTILHESFYQKNNLLEQDKYKYYQTHGISREIVKIVMNEDKE